MMLHPDIKTTQIVALGDRSYPIHIGSGLTTNLSTHLSKLVKNRKIHIVTDQTVYDHYKTNLYSLDQDVSVTVLEPGEAQKSFATLQKVLDDMFAAELSRSDYILAFGGGVIGDLTGFAASVYKRGCEFIQIPTTLLAQVDSSVGGKTAINVPQGKNLVGAFYQPKMVLIDTDVLSTLPEREIKAGYAEILKYGLLGDKPFFDWLADNGQKVLALDPDALANAIAISCETKARIVAADEREKGQRALLNLGHTFAHALETAAGYGGRLLHGEAVSAGMEMAFEYSARQDHAQSQSVDILRDHLGALNMPTIESVADLLTDPDQLIGTMLQDKKNESGELTLILARDIGEAFVKKRCDKRDVHAYLADLSKRYA